MLVHIRETSDARVLMLGARGLQMARARSVNLGADAYMTKPFTDGDLVARVRSLLASRWPPSGGRPVSVDDRYATLGTCASA